MWRGYHREIREFHGACRDSGHAGKLLIEYYVSLQQSDDGHVCATANQPLVRTYVSCRDGTSQVNTIRLQFHVYVVLSAKSVLISRVITGYLIPQILSMLLKVFTLPFICVCTVAVFFCHFFLCHLYIHVYCYNFPASSHRLLNVFCVTVFVASCTFIWVPVVIRAITAAAAMLPSNNAACLHVFSITP